MPSTPPTTPPTASTVAPNTPPAPPPAVAAPEEHKNWWQKTSRWGKVAIIFVGIFVAILMINATNQPRPTTYVFVPAGSTVQVSDSVDGVTVVPLSESVQTTAKVDLVSLYKNEIEEKARILGENLDNMAPCRSAHPDKNVCQEDSLKSRQDELKPKIDQYNVAVKSDEVTRAKYDLPKHLDENGKPV